MHHRARFGALAVGLAGLMALAACAGSSQAARERPTTSILLPASSAPPTSPATTMQVTTIAPSTTAVPTTAPSPTTTQAPLRAGATRYKFRYGPIAVKPGQNNIELSDRAVPRPPADGWIVRMKPDLERADGTVPPVDVIHLHHGVWLNLARRDATTGFPERFLAAGEEKTITTLPDGFGYPYHSTDRWVINYMLHNLYETTEQVWLTYELDVVPFDAAPGTRDARPVWLDVQNGSGYPVFDVLKGSGNDGIYTYPTDAPDAYGDRAPLNQWTVDRDSVLLATAGHVHPGGLYTDLDLRRGDLMARVFRSETTYWEPAGPVSWDMAAGATPEGWRAAVKAGDVLRVSATYETEKSSWYESMGIMVVWMADGQDGPDPFTTPTNVPGVVTHGPLAENRNHGGEPAGLPDASTLPGVPALTTIPIENWIYAQGDTSEGPADIPTVKAGGSITFDNLDAPLDNGIWHTVTSCKAPCNRSTGIAYPLADGDAIFDSGQLGNAGQPTAGRTDWTTPADLAPGTYTYFCRIHPFMRGAFRVEP